MTIFWKVQNKKTKETIYTNFVCATKEIIAEHRREWAKETGCFQTVEITKTEFNALRKQGK